MYHSPLCYSKPTSVEYKGHAQTVKIQVRQPHLNAGVDALNYSFVCMEQNSLSKLRCVWYLLFLTKIILH